MDDTVSACQVKTHLAALLNRVENGEKLTVTRKGWPLRGWCRPALLIRCLRLRPWSSGSANSGKA
jgi:hypothetical protein